MKRIIVLFGLLLLSIAACRKQTEEPSNKLIYFNDHVRFEYPNSWTGGKIGNNFALQFNSENKSFILFQQGKKNETDTLESIMDDIEKSIEGEVIVENMEGMLGGQSSMATLFEYNIEGVPYLQKNIVAINEGIAHIIIFRVKKENFNSINPKFESLIKSYTIT